MIKFRAWLQESLSLLVTAFDLMMICYMCPENEATGSQYIFEDRAMATGDRAAQKIRKDRPHAAVPEMCSRTDR